MTYSDTGSEVLELNSRQKEARRSAMRVVWDQFADGLRGGLIAAALAANRSS